MSVKKLIKVHASNGEYVNAINRKQILRVESNILSTDLKGKTAVILMSPLRKVFLDKINRINRIFEKCKTLIINNIILINLYAFLKTGFLEWAH